MEGLERAKILMRIFLYFILFTFTGCVSSVVPLKKSPPSSSVNNALTQPPIVDPLSNSQVYSQTHVYPYFLILFSVLLICFVPYLYVKLKPSVLIIWSKFLFRVREKRRLKESNLS